MQSSGPVLALIDPKPSRLGLAALAAERADRRVITTDLVGAQHMAADGLGQRR